MLKLFMLSISSLDFLNRQVLVRCDLDVLDEFGEITEYYRLNSSLQTLNFILKKGGFLTIAGHFKSSMMINSNEDKSYNILTDFFQKNLINSNFKLLPNLRNDPREVENNSQMAWELSLNQDLFINESFATSHREHTSICEITKYLPSYLGFHFEKEVENLNKVVLNPKLPLTVIIGGAKVESKLPTINNFLKIASQILVGGKVCLSDELPQSPKITSAKLNQSQKDLSDEDVKRFTEIISNSATIFWSGPLGKIEEIPFDQGSKKIAQAIIDSKAYSVVGGGDTISFLEKGNLLGQFSFISVGGSALLEFLSTKTLIGLEYIKKYGQKDH